MSLRKLIEPQEVRDLWKDVNQPAMAFSEFLELAIEHDYLLICAVTSHTQGRIKSKNLPYGVGKCHTSDTKIPMADGRVIQIKDVKPGDKVLSLGNNWLIRPAIVKSVIVRKDNCLKIRTYTGKTSVVTKEHPFLTGFHWKELQYLRVDDYIAVPRTLRNFGTKEIRDCEAKILGCLISEGNLTSPNLGFYNKENAFLEDYIRSVNEYDGNLNAKKLGNPQHYYVAVSNKVPKYEKSTSNGKIRKAGTSLKKWLVELGLFGTKCATKFVPSIIFELPKRQLALFLNRLFTGDGTVYVRDDGLVRIEYSSKSERLVRDVTHLLLRFGIKSHITPKRLKAPIRGKDDGYDTYWELGIFSEDNQLFGKEIGFYGEKRKRLNKSLTIDRKRDKIREGCSRGKNNKSDVVPLGEILRRFGLTVGQTEIARVRNWNKTSVCGRKTLKEIGESLNHQEIKLIANSDVYWDKIVSIEDAGEREVVDLEIEGTSNFIANDIFAHNTTFAMWTSYVVNAAPGTYPPVREWEKKGWSREEIILKSQRILSKYNPFDLSIPEVQQNWNNVFRHMVYNVADFFRMIKPGQPERVNIGVWDDTPATAPAERGVPKAIYKLKGFLTTSRPEIACVFFTASNRNEIVAPLRRIITIEIIIAERGVYEVQKVQFYKKFNKPELDISKLVYMEEGTFPPLPQPVQIRYDAWREQEKMKIFPHIEKDLLRWLKLQSDEDFEGGALIEGNVIRAAGYYVVKIPKEVGQLYHHRQLRVLLPKEEDADDA